MAAGRQKKLIYGTAGKNGVAQGRLLSHAHITVVLQMINLTVKLVFFSEFGNISHPSPSGPLNPFSLLPPLRLFF